MLTVEITIIIVLAALAIVWYGFRRTRLIRKVSGQLSGPVEQMQEQLLLTADSAIDRLDNKMAQMEILLSELDRRSNLLAQQSQRQQVLQNQLEQQQKQLTLWFAQQRQELEQELDAVRLVQKKIRTELPSPKPLPAVETQTPVKPAIPVVAPRVAPIAVQKTVSQNTAENIKSEQAFQRAQKSDRSFITQEKPTPDKRTVILEMDEQGMSVEDIAKKMGVGKGEVMLLLKLRRKANP